MHLDKQQVEFEGYHHKKGILEWNGLNMAQPPSC